MKHKQIAILLAFLLPILINLSNILTLIHNLNRQFHNLFTIFTLYSFVTFINTTKNSSQILCTRKILIIGCATIVIEFVLQFIINLNAFITKFHLFSNQFCFIFYLNLILTRFNLNDKYYLVLILVGLTRLYSIIILVQSPYAIYFCATCGCLFANYVQFNLNLSRDLCTQQRRDIYRMINTRNFRRVSLPTIKTKDKHKLDNTSLDLILKLLENLLNETLIKTNEKYAIDLKLIRQIIMKKNMHKSNSGLLHKNKSPMLSSSTTSSSSRATIKSTQNTNTIDLYENISLSSLNSLNHNSIYSRTKTRRSLPTTTTTTSTTSTQCINRRLLTQVSASGSLIIQDNQMLPLRQRSSSLKTTLSSTTMCAQVASSSMIKHRKSLNETQMNDFIRDCKNENGLQEQEQQQQQQQQDIIQTSDYESGESPSSSDSEKVMCKKLEGIKEERNVPRVIGNDQNLPWNPIDCDKLEILNYIHDWSFPIFNFADESNNFVLSKMAYKIFKDTCLFEAFNIPIDAFIHYFHALECGYRDLPYHNRIHAADVLHACHYLTTQSIPYLDNSSNKKILNGCRGSPRTTQNHRTSNPFHLTNQQDTYGCLASNFLPLELLALYIAAAQHDYAHPGRTNQFLIATDSPLALLYNDKSVLENHHAAASWQLLKSNEKFNFLCNLDSIEWKRLRFLILENILSTDLTKHSSILEEFKTKTTYSCTKDTCLDWQKDDDRLLVSQIVIKLADINAPLKEKHLHLQWTDRIMEEFYDQGDEERQYGLQVSDYMDRSTPNVPKLQELFMKNLVGSICNAYSQAGYMPGILIADNTHSSGSCSDDELDSEEIDTYKQNKKHANRVIYSELMSNFNANLEMWIELANNNNNNSKKENVS